MIHYKTTIRIVSLFLIIGLLCMGTTLIPSLIYGDPMKNILFFAFFPLSLIIVCFLIYHNVGSTFSESLSIKESLLVVLYSWCAIVFIGACPYFFLTDLSLTDSFFESISGLTTTGASVMSNLEGYSYGILFWRSLTNWLGGMGIIVLFLAIIPFLNIGNNIYKAEAPGPATDKLTSRIAQTAKRLWLVYICFTLIFAVILFVLGMNFFDALCHSLTTMATGGFSTKSTSLAGFSWDIQAVTSIFMFIAGCNFLWHIKLFQGDFKNYAKNEEFKVFVFFVFLATFVISFNIFLFGSYDNILEIINDSFFQVVSLLTTTGYTSADYTQWPLLSQSVIFFLLFMGACGGSTSGGIKLSRVWISVKYSLAKIKYTIKPHHLFPVLFDKKVVKEREVSVFFSFIILYLFIFVIGVFLVIIFNPQIDLITALTTSISCLSNVGPGLGMIGPTENFAWLTDSTKWLLGLLMIIGRLELYTVLILFSQYMWTNKS